MGHRLTARRRPTRSRTVLASALLAAATGLGVAGCGDSGATARQDVGDSYTRWSAAVAQKNGDTAANLLSTSSLSYFDSIRRSALDDDRKALAARTAVDQLTVLSFRANLPSALLRTGSAQAVVSAGVTHGVISPGSGTQAGLGQISVDGDRAKAVLKMAGETPQSYSIGFVRERGDWKFDLTSLLPVGQASLEQVQRASGLSTEKLVQTVERDRVGTRRAEQLWTPLGRT